MFNNTIQPSSFGSVKSMQHMLRAQIFWWRQTRRFIAKCWWPLGVFKALDRTLGLGLPCLAAPGWWRAERHSWCSRTLITGDSRPRGNACQEGPVSYHRWLLCAAVFLWRCGGVKRQFGLPLRRRCSLFCWNHRSLDRLVWTMCNVFARFR